MDIGINANAGRAAGSRLDGATAAGTPAAEAAGQGAGNAGIQPELTITRANVSTQDIEAAAIPESALSLDDALGRLVSGAFNLAPPPPPVFD